MIEKIKKVLDCKTDSDLARKLEVERNTVFRWKNNGFHPSTERMISLLLDKIDGDTHTNDNCNQSK